MVRIVIWSFAFSATLAAAAFASGDSVKGAEVFNRCSQCHTITKGGGNGLGPNLFGVVGRNAASLPNFGYSPALKNSQIVWSEDMLRKWLQGPSKLVPGTRMVFAGLTRSQDVDDVVAYLKSKN